MKVLVACEESQAVCKAFRELGHEAYSCDIQECSGGHPEWHIQQDVLEILNPSIQLEGLSHEYYGIKPFLTMDGEIHFVTGKWDLLIAHPPCTYLTVTGNRWFQCERYGAEAQLRWNNRCIAIVFFLAFAYADIPRIAIENPVGCMSTYYRKPEQVIHPYMFGDPSRKATCLWLKGLPLLKETDVVEPDVVEYRCKNGKKVSFSKDYVHTGKARAKSRSKTFPGIAKAMADQWGGVANDS